MSEVIDSVSFPANARVLELGCGENRHPQASVAVDVRQTPCVDFPCDFNETPMPIADADFDIVYSQFMLEHLSFPKVLPLLQDCLRILRPGGMGVLWSPIPKNNSNGFKPIQTVGMARTFSLRRRNCFLVPRPIGRIIIRSISLLMWPSSFLSKPALNRCRLPNSEPPAPIC